MKYLWVSGWNEQFQTIDIPWEVLRVHPTLTEYKTLEFGSNNLILQAVQMILMHIQVATLLYNLSWWLFQVKTMKDNILISAMAQ